MNERPKQAEFEAVADLMAIPPSFVEKDWFVTLVVTVQATISYKTSERRQVNLEFYGL